MSGVMASVDQRTQLAGRNRLELLMFRLHGQQLYGINVFKVREVLQCPKLSSVPQSHPVIRGISNIRGQTISIMDLSLAIGGPPINDIENAFVIISEYNRSIQGFLVREVDRIINLNWKDMLPPPSGTAGASYLTAVTYVNEKMVEVIDVERVLSEVIGAKEHVSEGFLDGFNSEENMERDLILVSDDSLVARKQVCNTIENDIKLKTVTTKDGKQALELLKSWADNDDPQLKRLAMVISDIEMPEMDGYTFTTEVRSDPRLKHLYIILHTSMSGVFNQTMVDRVGANKFIAKFEPDLLASAVIEALDLLRSN
jgi:two-component system, chemotaxis family, chemotaxis protein CheV